MDRSHSILIFDLRVEGLRARFPQHNRLFYHDQKGKIHTSRCFRGLELPIDMQSGALSCSEGIH